MREVAYSGIERDATSVGSSISAAAALDLADAAGAAACCLTTWASGLCCDYRGEEGKAEGTNERHVCGGASRFGVM